MTIQETTTDRNKRIDNILAKLAAGEIPLNDAPFDICEWLEEIKFRSNDDIKFVIHGTIAHDSGDTSHIANKEIALLLYKNKFLIEFEIDTHHHVFTDDHYDSFAFVDIKQLIFTPNAEQIAEATNRTKALIDQYELKCQEEREKEEEKERLFYLSLEEDEKWWKKEGKAEMEKQRLEAESHCLEMQKESLKSESKILKAEKYILELEKQLLASGFLVYFWHNTKKNIKNFIYSVTTGRRST